MKFFEKLSNCINLYKKEQLLIILTVLAFVVSGFYLPELREPVTDEVVALVPDEPSDDTDSSNDTLNDDSNKTSETNEEIDTEPSVPDEPDDSSEKPSDSKPSGNELSNSKPSEKPSSSKPSGNDSADSKPSDKPANPKPSGGNTTDSKPSNGESTDSKPSDGESTDSKPSNDSPSTKPQETPKQEEEKVWVPPVYETVHHEAVYDVVRIVVCNYCSEEFKSVGEFQVHKDAHGG